MDRDGATKPIHTIVVHDGGSAVDNVFGAVNFKDTAAVTHNRVVVDGGVVNNVVLGAYHLLRKGDTSAVSNRVTISGGTLPGVAGAIAESLDSGNAVATGNTITISGGTLHSVDGADAYSNTSGDAIASDNVVDIRGGTFHGSVYGASVGSYSGAAVATNNTVIVSGTPDFAQATLLGGYVETATGTTAAVGNTLQMACAGMTVYGLYDFQGLEFELPRSLAAGATVLAVTHTADLGSDMVVSVRAAARLALHPGDRFTLIDVGAAGVLAGNVAAASKSGTLNGYRYTIEQNRKTVVLKIGARAPVPAAPPP